MSSATNWSESTLDAGTVVITVSSWAGFQEFVHSRTLRFRDLIWRGQRCDNWLLESTLDRKLKSVLASTNPAEARQAHLERFKLATRGRRGTSPPIVPNENDWWALGQHHGLATPLLDWTTSPYVAAYFAFSKLTEQQTPNRAVHALWTPSISEINNSIDGIQIVRPMSDDNARLVNQSGLFTRQPDGVDVETWIKRNFKDELKNMIYFKVLIPDSERTICLQSLNRMNINHLTLFPDLYGASKHCNTNLEIDQY